MMKPPYHSAQFWFGMIATIAVVVGVRELALFVCSLLGMPTATNIVGLVGLFAILMGVRSLVGLPNWLTQSASVLLVDSGFAFLPVSAGAGILLFGLGEELIFVCVIIGVSVIVPLWLFAKLSQKWLNTSQ
ncbi:MAG: CidA/LrgA family protein [Moraxella sp.]|nr:CidA/LrgA family protein [Moraxella sp.]